MFIQKDITSPTIYETRFIASVPLPDGSVRVFEPGGYATNGGVIMEQIKDGE